MKAALELGPNFPKFEGCGETNSDVAAPQWPCPILPPAATSRYQLPGPAMTSISQTAAPARAQAAPKAKARNAALDRARTFITMLVLIHHSVIAYTYFGHTDNASFLGFDRVSLFNDSFPMAAMFFLSGLFVWPSLQRKGIGWFLRDRWWRLGFPYIVCVVLLMPFAYWAIELELHNPNTGFGEFWWEDGRGWTMEQRASLTFVWVFLALDVIAALVFTALSGWVEAVGKLSLESLGGLRCSSGRC